jgi:hypothetical protein
MDNKGPRLYALYFQILLGSKQDWEEKYDNLYRGLRYRWFIDVKKFDSEDIFGYENLRFQKITRFEPGQILENIVEKKITKQNKNEWFHPNFNKDRSGKALTGHRLKNEVAKRSALEGLVPLYDIFDAVNNVGKSLLEYTLEKLANERITQLRAEVEDGKTSLVTLLEHVLPEIEEQIENDNIEEEEISYAWSTLGAKWQTDMLNYLKSLLNEEMHVIQLPSNEISRATSIYESINKGGVSLNTYDLVVAKAARIRSERSLTQKI